MGKKVLVCDDDAGITDVISMILKISGIDAVSQPNSINFFNSFTEYQPDLVIVDLWMPGLSGDTITHRLKTDATTKHIPVIVISASRDGEKVAYNAQADKFIPKPFDLKYFIATVNSFLTVP